MVEIWNCYNGDIKNDKLYFVNCENMRITEGDDTMKCKKCNGKLCAETGEFSMEIEGQIIKVINAPVLHCQKCNEILIDCEVKENVKEFSKIYLSNDTIDYAECEAANIVPIMNLLL